MRTELTVFKPILHPHFFKGCFELSHFPGESEDICGSPPAAPTYAPEPPTPGYDTPATHKGSHYGHKQYGQSRYGAHGVNQGHPADPIYRQDHQPEEEGYGQENEVDHYGGGHHHKQPPAEYSE